MGSNVFFSNDVMFRFSIGKDEIGVHRKYSFIWTEGTQAVQALPHPDCWHCQQEEWTGMSPVALLFVRINNKCFLVGDSHFLRPFSRPSYKGLYLKVCLFSFALQREAAPALRFCPWTVGGSVHL